MPLGVIRKPTASTPVRDRLAAAQAVRAERINKVEAGELVKAVDIQAEWLDIIATVRQRLAQIPARVAARHPGQPAIIATIESELAAALNAIADDRL